MPQRNVPLTRVYDNEYYSGSQAALYIGDVWVDDVIYFNYRKIQNKQPIYGYASQLWDDASAGHTMVDGSFAINYKEHGYLWAVLRRWHSLDSEALDVLKIKDPVKRSKARALIQNKLGSAPNTLGGRPIVGSNGTKVSRSTIERITDGDAPLSERYQFYNNLAGYSTFDIESPRDKIFEDIVEAFEDEIWKTADDQELIEQVRNTDNNLFDGFDMYITLGNYANPKANHTAFKIIDVRLTSRGMEISTNDETLLEQYSFVARTIA